jgi:hypothetical protein
LTFNTSKEIKNILDLVKKGLFEANNNKNMVAALAA